MTRPRHDTDGASYHGARAALYSALGAAFCYPEAATIDDLTDAGVREGLRRAAEELGIEVETDRFLEALADADVDSLADTHTELFGLPDEGSYPVVPYEAAYTTSGGIGFEQRRIATIVGLLETFDLERSDGFHERQDHVAVELELLQVLAAKRGVTVSTDDDALARRLERAEATVLEDHLIDFVPAFAHDVREATDDPFYRAAAALAAALVRLDRGAHDRVETQTAGANGEPSGDPGGEQA